MIIYVDIDGTICEEVKKADGSKDYPNHKPIYDRIEYLNSLYDEGHEIHYWTARGAKSGLDWTELTNQQIREWGCKCNSVTVGGKPHFDIYVCDKSFNADAWFTHQKLHKKLKK
jgi:hypothetical protein